MLLRFRRFVVIGAGVALLVAVTAGPLAAASKTYTVSVNPSKVTYLGGSSQTQSFSYTFTNTTPSASINSVTLSVPTTGYYTITGVTGATEGSVPSGNATFTRTTITVQNLNPLNNGDSVTIAFSASIDMTKVTCQNNVATWVPVAYNGSNLSGSVFTPTNTATTTITSQITSGVQVTTNGCSIVNISRNGNTVQVLKPAGSTVNLTITVVWDPEPAGLPLPVDTVTAADGSTTPIQWCGGTPPSNLTIPTGQISCLVTETAKAYGPDGSGNPQIQVQDVVNVVGDYVLQH